MKKIIKIVLPCSLIVIVGGAYLNSGKSVQIIESQSVSSSASNYVLQTESLSQLSPSEIDLFIADMVNKMQAQHGHEISDVRIQASLADFKQYILEEFNENGLAIFTQIISQAFPQYAQQIFALLDKLAQYDNWHVDNLLTLNDLNFMERKGRIWKVRHEMFGSDADLLWEHELNDANNKQETVLQTIESLGQANNIALQERLDILQKTIDEQYGETEEGLLIGKGMVSQIFFGLDSVQNNLKALSPEERQKIIDESRQRMGFSEADIKQLAERDRENEARWQNGYAYMNARDQLKQNYSGEQLDGQLKALRDQYFKKESKTIAAEEDSGFYRFQRPRVYGSN